ncbi:MAG TPA: transposase, partial [Ktedonobacteraceae bacterium]
MKAASQQAEGEIPTQEEAPVAVQEWRPDPGKQVARTIATRRAERDARYQQAIRLREQGLAISLIAYQLGVSERTVRHWFKRGVAPNTRPRRKRQSDFDSYAPYVLKRWQDGERNGTRLWQEIAEQGYPGSQRMVYRFLKTLKKTEVKPTADTPQVICFSSTTVVYLFMRYPDNLDESERMNLAVLRQTHPDLESAYCLPQDFLQMLRKREGKRLGVWLADVRESGLPELASFAHGVEQDQAAV